jgi:peptide/nickel transport system permease protein
VTTVGEVPGAAQPTTPPPPEVEAESRRLAGMHRFIAQIRSARGVPKWILYSGVGIVLFFTILAIFAPLIAPYGFADSSSGGVDFPKQAAPSGSHPFGTTVQATDVLSRVIWGARTEIEVVVLSVLFALAIGVPLGLISGYIGGKLDRVLVLIMDALFAFPYLLLAIVIAFLLSDKIGQGILTAAIAITVVYIPQYFRVVRNHVISVREEPYVEAARALGAKRRTIIGRYVFFNVIQNVPVIATLNAADAILTLAALGFLGYGIQPTQAAEWGYDVQRAIADAADGIWWTGLFPGLAIVLLVTGFTLVGEGLNDILNPLIRYRRVHRPDMEEAPAVPAGEPAGGER